MKKIINTIVLSIAALLIVGMIPINALATPQNGDVATTDYQNTLVGSDGGNYYRTGTQKSLQYISDGSTKIIQHENYSGARRHYLVKMADEKNYYGYCIEQGIDFPDNQNYKGNSYKSDSYFTKLPSAVRNGIMLTTIFGRQPGKEVPVAGCNDDDWYWATQVILWEYQQKLRTSPTSIKSNGLVSADYFFSTLKGRPAEKCYQYMLKEMTKYTEIPSFTSSKASTAKTQILHWNSKLSLWETTVKDTKKLNITMRIIKGKINIIKNGDSYLLQSKSKMPLTTLEFQKKVDLPSHEMLIWGSGTSSQALVTGTADPIFFFMKVRTEGAGTLELTKKSEDGRKSGFKFQMIDVNNIVSKGTTNESGIWSISLPAGSYRLVEEKDPNYRSAKEISVLIKENQTTKVEINNILAKGYVSIEKVFRNLINSTTGKESDAVFQIYSDKYRNFDETPPLWRDQITTDMSGIATSRPLPLGDYIVHQIGATANLVLSQDIHIKISTDNANIKIPVENIQQRGRFFLKKTDNPLEGSKEKGLEGAAFNIRAAEDIIGPDGKVLVTKGEIVASMVTDTTGVALSDWLNPGRYEITETHPPKGYVLPEKPTMTAQLAADNQKEATFTKRIVIKNDKQVLVPKTADSSNDFNTGLWILFVTSAVSIIVLSFTQHVKPRIR